MGVNCWAAVLGGCDERQSGEHLVSAAIFSSPSILVLGPIWNTERPKTIGLASLTANILCAAHNSQLSPVDSASGEAMKALDGFSDVFESRSKVSAREFSFTYTFRLNGPLFERFLVKTLINMVVARDVGYRWPGRVAV